MTTIAWDGKFLAADKGAWVVGHINRVRKVFHYTVDGEPVLYATCGEYSLAMAIRNWLADRRQPKPEWRDWGIDGVHGGSVVGLAVYKLGQVFEVTAMGLLMPVEGHGPSQVFSAGAGREMALGALLAGATAQRAVEISIENSDYGGHGVDVVSFDDHGGLDHGKG